MNVMICGKGGSGKSTITALLTAAIAKRKQRVLVVDVDESNIGLYRMLGLEMPVPLMDHFGGKKGFQSRVKSSGISFGGGPSLFPQKMGIDQMPEECVAKDGGIHAVSIGKIHHFGEGCACPMGRLFKMLFGSLIFETDDRVLVDTSAGVEHFGRSLDNQCDHVLCVIDPSYESIVLAGKVTSFASEINLPVSFVLNKVTSDTEAALVSALKDVRIAGKVYQDQKIFLNTLEGKALAGDQPGLDDIIDVISK